jgi:uncharacterized protein
MDQLVNGFLKKERLSIGRWIGRVLLALSFIGLSGLVYFVFSPYRPLLPKWYDFYGRTGLILILACLFLFLRKSRRYEKYSILCGGLLIMTIAVSLDWLTAIYQIKYLGVNGNSPAGFALQKVNQCIIVTGVIIFLTPVLGCGLGSIYIQKGRLKLGLAIGMTAFVLAAVGSIPMANMFFKGDGLTLADVLPWIPWVLVIVFANAAQEELLFRGLFLKKLQPFFGRLVSNLMIVFVFTLLHKGVTYSADELTFLVVVIPLAFAWGYLTQKTESIWGSILFHAGMDIPIILGIIANMA